MFKREEKINWVGLSGVFCHKASQNALPQLVVMGLRQELFYDLELSLLLQIIAIIKLIRIVLEVSSWMISALI